MITTDRLLRDFFGVFLFENLAASDQRADSAYQREAAESEIYLGLFGADYGNAKPSEKSPTELELDASISARLIGNVSRRLQNRPVVAGTMHHLSQVPGR